MALRPIEKGSEVLVVYETDVGQQQQKQQQHQVANRGDGGGAKLASSLRARQGVVPLGKLVSDYFNSGPCLNEIRRGVQKGIPIVFLLETDPTHGGVPLEVHRRDCPPDLQPLLELRVLQDVLLVRLLRALLHLRELLLVGLDPSLLRLDVAGLL